MYWVLGVAVVATLSVGENGVFKFLGTDVPRERGMILLVGLYALVLLKLIMLTGRTCFLLWEDITTVSKVTKVISRHAFAGNLVSFFGHHPWDWVMSILSGAYFSATIVLLLVSVGQLDDAQLLSLRGFGCLGVIVIGVFFLQAL